MFAGMGGMASAWPEAQVMAAVDINQRAQVTYERNHRGPFWVREIESLTDDELAGLSADLWWMSPPCQPYTRRGKQRDLLDLRAKPLLRMISAINVCRPNFIALENVIGFAASQSYARLREMLDGCGYHTQCIEACPSHMGWPNRRPRFYLLASRLPLAPWKSLPMCHATLPALLVPLTESERSGLQFASGIADKYAAALDCVDAEDGQAVSACFASSYGKAYLKSGSYVRDAGGLRRFAPREVARLLGFPDSFQLDHLSQRGAWKLLGNSLSLPVVRYVLSHVEAPCGRDASDIRSSG
jgi:site-specific DNA-cytosine methylase